MRHFCRHANAFAQRGVRVNRLTNIHCISAHLYRQCNLADHVACMRADDAAAQNLAVAMDLRAVVKQEFGESLVSAIGNSAS